MTVTLNRQVVQTWTRLVPDQHTTSAEGIQTPLEWVDYKVSGHAQRHLGKEVKPLSQERHHSLRLVPANEGFRTPGSHVASAILWAKASRSWRNKHHLIGSGRIGTSPFPSCVGSSTSCGDVCCPPYSWSYDSGMSLATCAAILAELARQRINID